MARRTWARLPATALATALAAAVWGAACSTAGAGAPGDLDSGDDERGDTLDGGDDPAADDADTGDSADTAPDDTADNRDDANDDANETPDGPQCPAPSAFVRPADRFAEYCGAGPRTPAPVTRHNACDAFVGPLGRTTAGDFIGVPLVVTAPFAVKSVSLYVIQAGTAILRFVRAAGESEPDPARPVAEPISVTFAADDRNRWKAVDLAAADITVAPEEKLWMLYEFTAGGAVLGLAACPPLEADMLVQTQAMLREQTGAFRWFGVGSGETGKDTVPMVRFVGETICDGPAGGPWFSNVSAEVLGAANLPFGRTAWADLDGDGDPDIVAHKVGSFADGILVLRNDGGRFTDITAATGLAGAFTVSAALADLDNDGDIDIVAPTYIDDNTDTAAPVYNALNAVFLNDGTGRFTRVAEPGIASRDPTAAVALGDIDGDGKLDLFLGNWLKKYPQPPAVKDRLYKGNGDGTFTDVTDARGLANQGPQNRPCYGALFADYDNDGDADLLVSNYGYEPNFLWMNDGTGNFVDAGPVTHLAQDNEGAQSGNGFGVDAGDINGDGWLDFYLATIAHPRYQPWSDRSRLMLNDAGAFGAPAFVNETTQRGIVWDEGDIEPAFVDFDNDGDLDLMVGATYPGHYHRLYRMDGDGVYTDVTALSGIRTGQGGNHAWADYDGDGDLDVLVGARSGLQLWRNDRAATGGRLRIDLAGTRSNRSAVGARIEVESCGRVQIREVRAGKGHFSSQGERTAHVGLGDDGAVTRVTVRWPGGGVDTVRNVPANARIRIREGDGTFTRN